MIRKRMEPGTPVPIGGLYWVHHYQHRLPHLVQTILSRFPECRVCGTHVRFEVVPFAAESSAGWLREDRDFAETALVILRQASGR